MFKVTFDTSGLTRPDLTSVRAWSVTSGSVAATQTEALSQFNQHDGKSTLTCIVSASSAGDATAKYPFDGLSDESALTITEGT